MTSDDPVIAALSDANPVARTVAPGPLERAEADRVLRRVMSSPPRSRHRPAVLAPVLSTLVVLGVVAVLVRSGGAGHSAAPSANAVNLTFQALPTAHTPVITPAAMAREVHILRKRLASVQGSYRVTLTGGDRIAVTSTNATSSTQARVVELVTERAELLFYDWEANALTPNGHTVASQLAAHNATALEISQGSSTAAPGSPGAGSVRLYQAVQLASKQPQAPIPISQHLSRIGAQYYMFAAPGSVGCAAVASAQHTIPIEGDHCLLAGPDDETPATTRRQAINSLVAQLPLGVNRADGQVLVVPQGTVVLQAASQTGPAQSFNSSSAQFFVLRDQVALSGDDITNPRSGTDQTGAPDVQVGFMRAGQNAFQRVTAQIAHRGANLSTAGQTIDQHFAVALDSHLLTVPSIGFRQYPDGIIGGGGADIIAGLTTQSARTIATELRLGALPLQLRRVR
jgi:SecD/SecF fusion protein